MIDNRSKLLMNRNKNRTSDIRSKERRMGGGKNEGSGNRTSAEKKGRK